MKKFKVTIRKIDGPMTENPRREYQIVKIKGAVGVVGAGPEPILYRVGDRLTEKDINRLFDNTNNDITVTI